MEGEDNIMLNRKRIRHKPLIGPLLVMMVFIVAFYMGASAEVHADGKAPGVYNMENDTFLSWERITRDRKIVCEKNKIIVSFMSAFGYKQMNLVIDDSIEEIGANVFRNNGIVAVTLPDSLKTIGDLAFNGNQITAVTYKGVVYEYKDDLMNALEENGVDIGSDPFSGSELKEGSKPAADINSDNYGAEVTFENESTRGSIEVTKYKDDKKNKLRGVTFPLSDADGSTVAEGTTGDDGKVNFENLMPGIYTITETNTVNGYSLLKDPIKVDLPLAMDKAQADKEGADTSKAAEYEGKFYFYDLKYDVANDVTLNLPMTGFFDHWTNYIGVVAALLLIGVGVVVLTGKKKVRKAAK